MLAGLLFAIGACFVWGLIFVVPQYLSDFTAVEVVLGRYFTYGILSTALFFSRGFKKIVRFSPKIWQTAFIYALISNLVYYLGIVAGLRLASPTLSVLIVGLAPITIALYGNWTDKEISYRDLISPCLLIFFGLVLVNAIEVDWGFQTKSLSHYLLGCVGILTALASWSWYAVHNARFLKRHPEILASEWSTAMGVATLFWVILIGALFALGMKEECNLSKFLTLSPDIIRYFMGATALGFACSWLGCFLWSQASVRLPISLMGPLLVFEMIFGLLFVMLFDRQLPSWIEIVGVFAMIGGILMSVNLFRKKRIAG